MDEGGGVEAEEGWDAGCEVAERVEVGSATAADDAVRVGGGFGVVGCAV